MLPAISDFVSEVGQALAQLALISLARLGKKKRHKSKVNVEGLIMIETFAPKSRTLGVEDIDCNALQHSILQAKAQVSRQ